jgi:glycolate oxidase FAD binding subunit
MSATTFAPLDAARLADPARYAMSGTPPRWAVRPATADEAAETLRAAARDSLGVVPWGGGTSLAREPAPAGYDVALDLSALDRVIEYDPEDFTVTVECGVTLAALRARLAANAQELPLEAPLATRATIGGVLAANASGPRRYRFGSPRDRILGARMLLGDGTLARTGGRVVKNVAGYAIHRLACGSRGGLLCFLEASFKLAVAPRKRVALVYGASAEQLADAARWSEVPRLELAVLSVASAALAKALPARADAPFTVVAGLEDDPAWVDEQARRLGARLGESQRTLEGADAEAMWQALADLEASDGPRLTFTTAANTPAGLGPLSVEEPAGTRILFHAPAGRLHVFAAPPDAQARVERFETNGFALIDAHGAGVVRAVPPPPLALADLRAKVRAALDP